MWKSSHIVKKVSVTKESLSKNHRRKFPWYEPRLEPNSWRNIIFRSKWFREVFILNQKLNRLKFYRISYQISLIEKWKPIKAIELEDFLNNDFLDQLDTIEIASEKWLLIVFYSLFLLFGFAANCLVIVVLITSHKELQSNCIFRSLFG